MINGSTMENEALGESNSLNLTNGPMKSEQIKNILETKLDKSDFAAKLNVKANKTDIEMIFRQITTIHK